MAKDLLAKLDNGDSITELLNENQLAWVDLDKVERNNAALPYMANQAFFKINQPLEGEVNYELAEDFQGFVLLMLNSVENGDWSSAEESEKNQRELFVNRYYSTATLTAFFEQKRLSADVRRNLENLIQN